MTKSGGDNWSPLSGAFGRHFVFNAPFQTGQFTTHAPAEVLAKLRVPWIAWTSGRLRIDVSRGSIEALRPWCRDTSRVVVTTDASTRVRGAVFEGIPASWLWSEPQSQWHINRLELEAVFLATDCSLCCPQGDVSAASDPTLAD